MLIKKNQSRKDLCLTPVTWPYSRAPIPKRDFNKVAMEPDWNHTLTWMFSSKFAAYFPNTFSEEHLSMAGSAVWYGIELVIDG